MSVFDTGLPFVAVFVFAAVYCLIGWHRAIERQREVETYREAAHESASPGPEVVHAQSEASEVDRAPVAPAVHGLRAPGHCGDEVAGRAPAGRGAGRSTDQGERGTDARVVSVVPEALQSVRGREGRRGRDERSAESEAAQRGRHEAVVTCEHPADRRRMVGWTEVCGVCGQGRAL